MRALERIDLADQVLRTVAEHANAKECVLALAEELERLCGALEQLDEDEENAKEEAGNLTQGMLAIIQCYILGAPMLIVTTSSGPNDKLACSCAARSTPQSHCRAGLEALVGVGAACRSGHV